MLDSTGDTDGNVEIGSNNLTGLTNLERVISKARIDSSSGSTNSSANGVSKRENELVKVLLVLKTTATRDDLSGRAKIGALGLGQVLGNPLGGGSGLGVGGVLNCSGTSTGRADFKGRGSNGDQLDGVGGLDSGQDIAGVYGAHKGVLRFNLGDVVDGLDIERSRDSGKNVLTESRAGNKNVRKATLGDVLGNKVGKVLSQTLEKTS